MSKNLLENTLTRSVTIRCAIALCALLTTFTAYAASPKLDSLEQVQAFANGVVQQATTDEAKAFALLKAHIQATKSYSTIAVADVDAVAARFESSAVQRLTGMGKPTGVEFISQKQVGKNVVRERYLQHRVRYPTLWTFDFYRTEGGWTLTGFNADSNAGDLLAP